MRMMPIAIWALAALALVSTAVVELLHWTGGPVLDYLPFLAAGACAMWLRPDHRAARRLLLAASLLGLSANGGSALSLLYLRPESIDPLSLALANGLHKAIAISFFAALVGLFAVFPDGHYQGRWQRWLVAFWWACVPVVALYETLSYPRINFNPWMVWAAPSVANPLYVPPLALLNPVISTFDDQTLIPFVLAVLLVALRYRRTSSEVRMQIRWPLLGLLPFVAVLASGIFVGLGMLPAWANGDLFIVAIVLLPVTIAIAIVRHRLFDIDLVIRKSLVYGVLWLAIAAAYAGLASLLGIAAGQHYPMAVAVILAIAASMAFQPARRWLEQAADRWVFGCRLSGYELVRRFGATLEETAALDQLAPAMAATVRGGLGVAWARVVVDEPGGGGGRRTIIGADGRANAEAAEPAATAPLVHAGEQIGAIECGPKASGAWTPADQDLLESLGRQAALAVRNSRLAAELADRLEDLAASRARIIRAEDAERRRIERNIHDGIQQDLVSLIAKLGLARSQLSRDPERVEALLAALQDETGQALEELRELARGIHPPVLTDRGLLEAIESRVARMPLGVTIEVDRALKGARFAEEVEAAAYFLVCEALTNSLKHSGAREAKVKLRCAEGRLELEVSDSGRGFESDGDRTRRGGLAGVADRVEAIGGAVTVTSCPGSGTRIRAELPGTLRDARVHA